ncbi:MAG: histidine kinase [Tissierellia bacterium]|nr:histidine kinase [Tissierellia bacterium]
MELFIIRLFIYFICTSFYFNKEITLLRLSSVLILLILSLLKEYFCRKKIDYFYYFLYGLCLFPFPRLLFFFPAISFDLAGNFRWKSCGFLILIFIKPDLRLFLASLFTIFLSISLRDYEDRIQYHRLSKNRLKEDALLLRKTHEQFLEEQVLKEEMILFQERERISRELHDSIGHTISSSIIQCKALEMIATNHREKMMICRLAKGLESGMEDIRNTLHHMNQSAFDLQWKINDLMKDITAEKNLFYYLDDEPVYELKKDIILMVKEAITNFNKHSNGNYFSITVKETKDYIILLMKDNGIVGDMKQGLGLENLENIAIRNHGKCTIGTENGFQIRVLLQKGKKDEDNHNRR